MCILCISKLNTVSWYGEVNGFSQKRVLASTGVTSSRMGDHTDKSLPHIHVFRTVLYLSYKRKWQ